MKIRRRNADNRRRELFVSAVIQDLDLSSDDIRRATVALCPESIIQDHRPSGAWPASHIVVWSDQPPEIGPNAQHIESVSAHHHAVIVADRAVVVLHEHVLASPL